MAEPNPPTPGWLKSPRKEQDEPQPSARPRSRSRSRDKNYKAAKRDEKSDNSDIDMFADDDELEKEDKLQDSTQKRAPVTDETGYFIPIVDATIGVKYRILEKLGKGVFGNVIKVVEIEDPTNIYALKVLRKNPATEASGYREFKILSQIHQKSKLKRIMKVHEFFTHEGHLCLVCEVLSIDLRSFTHKKQPTLADIRIYAIGMMLISHELRLSKIVHADIKPDNFLFKSPVEYKPEDPFFERNTIDNLKLADFGTSFRVDEYSNSVEEQVARYYRAPEIILGTQIKKSEVYAIDVWAIGCSLFELFTNQFLFNGSSNNEMLKLMMQTKGKFHLKMLNKSIFKDKHFDNDYNFLYQTFDKVTKEPRVQKMQVTITAERELFNLLKKHGGKEDPKQLQKFRDFLQKCFTLNPKDRMTPSQAIEHPFLHYQTKLQG